MDVYGQLGTGRQSNSIPGAVIGAKGLGLLNLLNLTPAQILAADADTVFGWAESKFPQYFGPAGQTSVSAAGYRYRFYPGTNSYLGANEAGLPRLYYVGPLSSGKVLDLGPLSQWMVFASATP